MSTTPATRPVPVGEDDRGPIWARNAAGKAICGSKKRKQAALCQSRVRMANGRCRLHGGATPRGPASTHFKTGLYTDLLRAGTPLGDGYRAVEKDEDLLTLREQIRLQDGRERELVTRIAEALGESGQGWRRARDACAKLEGAIGEQDAAAVRLALDDLSGVLQKGRALEAVHAELREVGLTRARLLDTQARLLEQGKQLYTAEQVLYMLGVVAAAATRAITDQQRLTAFVRTIQAVVDGRQVRDLEVAEVLSLAAPSS